MTRAVSCRYCHRCFEDGADDGQPPRIVHPETANVVAYWGCPECRAKLDAETKQAVERERSKWLAEIQLRKLTEA